MAKRREKPRVVVKMARIYERIPQESNDIEGYSYYFAAQHQFAKNRHWEYFPCIEGINPFALKTHSVTHYDKQGRPIHEFNEDKDGVTEISWVYVELPDGECVTVQSVSDGSVYISHGEQNWTLKNGSFGWGMVEPVQPKEQIEYEEYEYKMMYGCEESELTPEEKAEFERRSKEAYKEVKRDKDKYGNPRRIEIWYCGILEKVIDYNYVYSDEKFGRDCKLEMMP